jgi:hypothetical protein
MSDVQRDAASDAWAAAHAAIERQQGAGDAAALAAEAAQRFARLRADYTGVFGSAEGLRVRADLERLFGGATYVAGDAVESHARSAQRGVLLRISAMTAAP